MEQSDAPVTETELLPPSSSSGDDSLQSVNQTKRRIVRVRRPGVSINITSNGDSKDDIVIDIGDEPSSNLRDDTQLSRYLDEIKEEMRVLKQNHIKEMNLRDRQLSYLHKDLQLLHDETAKRFERINRILENDKGRSPWQVLPVPPMNLQQQQLQQLQQQQQQQFQQYQQQQKQLKQQQQQQEFLTQVQNQQQQASPQEKPVISRQSPPHKEGKSASTD